VTSAVEQSEQFIMAVNILIQDSQDENPLICALAIRTMTCIRVGSVAEHFVIPLKKHLKDKSSYIRKTVSLGIAKLYSIIPGQLKPIIHPGGQLHPLQKPLENLVSFYPLFFALV
jgi:AP-1 complex subunit beta-1